MKYRALMCALFAITLVPLRAQEYFRLENGLTHISEELSASLADNTRVAVLEVSSGIPAAAEYLVQDLKRRLLETRRLVLVDRGALDVVKSELAFQVSGDVRDDTMLRLGAILGVEAIVTGSFEPVGRDYRLTVKSVEVESSRIQYIMTIMIVGDDTTALLFGQKTAEQEAAEKMEKAFGKFLGRLLCSAINPYLGIGSFLQGDVNGGFTVIGLESFGLLSLLISSASNPSENYMSAGWLSIGIGSFCGGIAYAWARPWVYNRQSEPVPDTVSEGAGANPGDAVRLSFRIPY